jgi:predicted lipid-binding transport protein (Tim44 family)
MVVTSRNSRIFSVLGLSLMMGFGAVAEADARRGGGFGSRGVRTYSAPPPTRTAPTQAQPIQRSMTAPRPGATAGRQMAGAPAAAARRPGFLGNPLVRGLMLGGVIGLLLGHGFGAGMAGMLGGLLQIGLVALAALVIFKLFASRRRPVRQTAAAGAPPTFRSPLEMQQPVSGGYTPAYSPSAEPYRGDDFAVLPSDREAFEALLREIQDAFGREDYAALRERTTPEIMGYLAEELGQNAARGVRNEVSDVQMLEGDVAESWREEDTDYATAAMRYSSLDVMRDRQTGAVVAGDPDKATETTELWTFTRKGYEAWKLSAIQEA